MRKRMVPIIGQSNKHVLGSFLVLMFLATVCASADETLKPMDSAQSTSSQAVPVAASVSVQPGPWESERIALLKKIQSAKGKGVGVQPYLAAFLDLEGMVGEVASPEAIRKKLDSLEAALNRQLSVPKIKASNFSKSSSDSGIIGLKFIISGHQSPEVAEVFPEGPAAKAQIRERDIIDQVDGYLTRAVTKEDIYGMLVGKPGTKVNLTIKRGDARFVKTLIRMSIKEFATINPDIGKMYLESM